MRAMIVAGLVWLTACGTSTDVPPSTRTKGSVSGAPVELVIGPAGGLVSAKRLEIVVPAGALAADTTISLTPITNTAPGGRGEAWRLGPEGTTFASPVTVRTNYEDVDVAGGAEEVLGIAYQDASGIWVMPGEQTRDPVARKVEVKTTHFSDWSLVVGAQLRPPSARVKTKATKALLAKQCFIAPVKLPGLAHDETEPYYVGIDCDDEDGLAPLPVTVSEWAVNGVVGGGGATGTISGTALGTGTFTAPDTKPSPDTVAVSARADVKPFGKVLLVSNLTIIDDAPLMRATGRYQSMGEALSPFVVGDVTDEGLQFWFTYPPRAQTVTVQSLTGGGLANVHDTRVGCALPSVSGGWDVVTATSVQILGSSFSVSGTYSHGAVTYGVGEGDCAAATMTQAASSGDFARLFDFPTSFFTSATPPADPVVVTSGAWTWTFQQEQ